MDRRDRLRRAAGEEVAPEPRPVDQRLGGLADLFETTQALRQGVGEFGRVGALGLRRRRQQQARLEIGEPGRHDEIIGRQLQAQFTRRLDESEILLGEREHGNARQIDLLATREFEQQVERPLETVEIDGESRLAVRSLDAKIVLQNRDAGHESPQLRQFQPWRAMTATARRRIGASTGAGEGGAAPFPALAGGARRRSFGAARLRARRPLRRARASPSIRPGGALAGPMGG